MAVSPKTVEKEEIEWEFWHPASVSCNCAYRWIELCFESRNWIDWFQGYAKYMHRTIACAHEFEETRQRRRRVSMTDPGTHFLLLKGVSKGWCKKKNHYFIVYWFLRNSFLIINFVRGKFLTKFCKTWEKVLNSVDSHIFCKIYKLGP